MSRVAIVTDTACDLSPERAAAAGITLVPLLVRFGDEELRTHEQISIERFYERLLTPGSPLPSTAACSPGDFEAVFRRLLDEGAEAVVCLTVGSRLSATYGAAMLAREALAGRPVHVVDSMSATLGQGLLALLAADAAAAGEGADAIVRTLEARRSESRIFVMLETLEYLRRGGRISAAQAAIGSVLSVKPIITIADGLVETLDRPRTASRARARLLELALEHRADRLAVIHTQAPGVEAFRAELAAVTGVPEAAIVTELVGPSIAPHVGPGAFGFVMLAREG